jgi:acyl CoA:acetate/3-ketoacid CoA transferase alpha subunit/acyl CoA:acetate/3-ketoacid CoA transferase beta subunit
VLTDIFEAPLVADKEKESKVVTLEKAIRKNMKPGMAIYIGALANAATREVMRQFWGTKPSFTVIGGGRYTAELVQYGLVKELIGAAFGRMYPVPGPSRAIQKAYKEGSIEIEDWTVLTMTQRLMAGAMDMGCMTTKSMVGSSSAQGNRHSFKEIKDPFGGQKLALVKALYPDIALVHGWAADCRGNVIMGAPNILNQDVWGARASRQGVVVTVEKIVSTDFVREHSYFVTIPAHMVDSVSRVPLGAHPQGMPSYGMGISEFEAYDADYDFMNDYLIAQRHGDKLDAWLKKWILDCSSQEDYLRKLGDKRVVDLKIKVDRNTWKHALANMMKTISTSSDYTSTERMMVTAAREIKEVVLRDKYKTLLTGMGASLMAAWLAYYQLMEEGYTIKPMVGIGLVGYSPRPGQPANLSVFNVLTAEMTSNAFETYGVFVGGLNNRCLSVLGAGQIDKNGNINSSRTTDGLYLMGSGGANDASNAQGVLVVARQTRDRFVDKVDYVTCPGERVKVLVSDKGVFKKLENDREFTLTGYLANPDLPTGKEGIRAVRENCGWELKVSPKVSEIPAPRVEELMMLRAFDPQGLFIAAGAER